VGAKHQSYSEQGTNEATVSRVDLALFSYKCRTEAAAFNLDCKTHLVSLAVFFPWSVSSIYCGI